MNSKAIQSANLHTATTHARAKADAVEGRPPLTFDGCGINGPDEYRTRLATFQDLEQGKAWGPLLAAAPEMAAALEACLAPLQEEYNRPSHTGHATDAARAFLMAKQALLKAKGSL